MSGRDTVTITHVFGRLCPHVRRGWCVLLGLGLWFVVSGTASVGLDTETAGTDSKQAVKSSPLISTKAKAPPAQNVAPSSSKKTTSQQEKKSANKISGASLGSSVPVAVCHLDTWSCQELSAEIPSICLYAAAAGNQCLPPTLFPKLCEPALSVNAFEYDSNVVDAVQIAKLLGNPPPFTLTSQGPNTLIISKSASAKTLAGKNKIGQDSATLDGVITWLRILISADVKASFELEIPHASALGDAAMRFNGYHSPFFTATNAGDRVRISISGSPSCRDLEAYLDAVRRIAWSTHPESPVARVYTLDASTASALVNAAAPSAKATDSVGGAMLSDDKTTPAKKGNASDEATSDDPSNDVSTDASSNGKSGGGKAKKSGKKTTATAASDNSNPNPGNRAQKAGDDGTSVPLQSPTTPAGDLIVFAEGTNPGDDSPISEQKRVLALLDLPRPEMIVNGWVLQTSTKSSEKFGAAGQVIRQTVNDHNAGLQRMILLGWTYLTEDMAKGQSYFDRDFYEYLTGATVVDNAIYSDPIDLKRPSADLQRRLSLSYKVTLKDALGWNICPVGQYCLGYTTLFQPLQPRLINLLLAIIAANDPVQVANCAINRVEEVTSGKNADCHSAPNTSSGKIEWADITYAKIPMRRSDAKIKPELTQEKTLIEETARDLRLVNDVNDENMPLDSVSFCEKADQVGILRQEARKSEVGAPVSPPNLYLECLRRTITLLLQKSPKDRVRPSTLGLARRAIADFLFNYKVSQQYPHEFTAYDLSQSADAFNSALNPLIEAFNRDLTAYQYYLRSRLRVDLLGRRIASKDSFLNDGIVSVAVVSGHPASVDTTSVSYLDDSRAPDVSTLAAALSGNLGGEGSKSGKDESGSSGGGESAKVASMAAKTAAAAGSGGITLGAQAALAGLATYQTTKIGISRELNLSVTPRSTLGASGAEMDVQLTSADSAAPKYWSSSNSSKDDPDLSRVGTHSVNTHIRVDSVVLFDLSSFSAVLANGRSLLPLLPPFVQLPYIGTLVGVPLPAAKEYHSSSAIVSAVVVPTATDLAFGIRFVNDFIVDSSGKDCEWTANRGADAYEQHYCTARSAQSLLDLARQPIREFNRRKIQCLATEDFSSVPDTNSQAASCNGLQFADVQHSAR
jgi:hypothetical protein